MFRVRVKLSFWFAGSGSRLEVRVRFIALGWSSVTQTDL